MSGACTCLKKQYKENEIMSQQYRIEKAIDQVVGRRMLSTCWLLAGLGCSILQMLLLAQAWSLSQQAMVPACLASAWVFGTVLGLRLRADARLLGSCLMLCAFLWLDGSRFIVLQTTTRLLPVGMVHLGSLILLALLLGTISSAWLSQRRLWSPAAERVTLARALVGTTAGLFVVWVLPAWAALLGLISLMPLFVFDMRYGSRAPQPEETGVVESWVSRYWQPEQRQMRLSAATLPRNWWWLYLVERTQESRGNLLLTLLASSSAVILGGIWAIVPTAFAGSLFETNELNKLGWLLAGQLIALTIGACVLRASRRAIGFPDRLLPSRWQSRACSLALLMLVVMGGSLVTLGLPLLQDPWWLALSLASYTLAGAIWGLLLPRLRPAPTTLIQAHRHLLLRQGQSLPDTLHMRYIRAQDERMSRFLLTAEGVLIACFIPFVGWLIDVYSGSDRVLILFGLCILLGMTLLAFIWTLRSLKYPQQTKIARSRLQKRSSRSWQPVYLPVRLAW
jgi:hypothetical protein